MERRNDTLISRQLQSLRIIHENAAATFAYLLNPLESLLGYKLSGKSLGLIRDFVEVIPYIPFHNDKFTSI